MLKSQAVNNILEDFGDSQTSQTCLAILEYLQSIKNNVKAKEHIAYEDLKKAIDPYHINKHILRSAQYLCGERTPALLAEFEIIDEEGSCYLKHAEVSAAIKQGFLIHPKTNKVVEDYQDFIFLYFKLGLEIKF